MYRLLVGPSSSIYICVNILLNVCTFSTEFWRDTFRNALQRNVIKRSSSATCLCIMVNFGSEKCINNHWILNLEKTLKKKKQSKFTLWQKSSQILLKSLELLSLSCPLADCFEFRACLAGRCLCTCSQNINKYSNKSAKRYERMIQRF